MTEKEYANEEVTVIWKSDRCIHSENCFKGLSAVFDPNKRPWVNVQGASTGKIVDQVNKCPSGALSYRYHEKPTRNTMSEQEQIVEAAKDGPLLVHGNVRVKHSDGREETRGKLTAFCRCGESGNKPFCDGTHKKTGFTG